MSIKIISDIHAATPQDIDFTVSELAPLAQTDLTVSGSRTTTDPDGVLNLSDRDRDTLLANIETPPAPTPSLVELFNPTIATLTPQYTQQFDGGMFYVRQVAPNYTRSQLSWISKGLKRAYEFYGTKLLPIEKKILNAESDKYPTTLYDARLAQFVHHFVYLTDKLAMSMDSELERDQMEHVFQHVFSFSTGLNAHVNTLPYANLNEIDDAFKEWHRNF